MKYEKTVNDRNDGIIGTFSPLPFMSAPGRGFTAQAVRVVTYVFTTLTNFCFRIGDKVRRLPLQPPPLPITGINASRVFARRGSFGRWRFYSAGSYYMAR